MISQIKKAGKIGALLDEELESEIEHFLEISGWEGKLDFEDLEKLVRDDLFKGASSLLMLAFDSANQRIREEECFCECRARMKTDIA